MALQRQDEEWETHDGYSMRARHTAVHISSAYRKGCVVEWGWRGRSQDRMGLGDCAAGTHVRGQL